MSRQNHRNPYRKGRSNMPSADLIYLDHHAATPLCAAADHSMAEARRVAWANPSSVHRAGQEARRVLEGSRDVIAEAIGAKPADVILTGGGTEACNMGVFGLGKQCNRVVTTGIEHPAVAESVQRLAESNKVEVVRLEAPDGAAANPEFLRSHVDESTLVAVQWVNHETGTVWPVVEYGEVCASVGAKFFVDGTQALGKVPVDVTAVGADAIAFASHKIGGPAGAGALWLTRCGDFVPVFAGGAQERGRRPGSPDPVAHAGFAGAAGALEERLAGMPRLATLRDRIENKLMELGAVRNATKGERVATVSNVSLRAWKGEALVAALDVEGLCVSSGSACSAGISTASPVLLNIHPDEPWRASSALRVSLGPEVDENAIDKACSVLERVVPRRKLETT